MYANVTGEQSQQGLVARRRRHTRTSTVTVVAESETRSFWWSEPESHSSQRPRVSATEGRPCDDSWLLSSGRGWEVAAIVNGNGRVAVTHLLRLSLRMTLRILQLLFEWHIAIPYMWIGNAYTRHTNCVCLVLYFKYRCSLVYRVARYCIAVAVCD